MGKIMKRGISYSGGGSGSSHTYSTSEQLIGKWIDGKDLYETTIVQTSGFSTSYSLPHGIADIDEIVKVDGLFQSGNGNYWYPINDNNPTSGYNACVTDIGKTSVWVYIGGSKISSIGKLTLTLRYTKSSS